MRLPSLPVRYPVHMDDNARNHGEDCPRCEACESIEVPRVSDAFAIATLKQLCIGLPLLTLELITLAAALCNKKAELSRLVGFFGNSMSARLAMFQRQKTQGLESSCENLMTDVDRDP